MNRAAFTCFDSSGQSIKLDAQKFINVSSTGFQFFCGVEGTVYLDRDFDRFFSMTDTPLNGIEVRLSTGEKTLTDALGRYRFENLYAGEYAVGINSITLPERYRQISKAPQVVVLSDGFTDTADFPIAFTGDDPEKTARLEGFVFYDKNQNLTYDSGDIAVETFKAIMSNKIYTGSDGKFIFTKLKPGTHTLRIQYGPKTLDKKVVLNHGKNLIKIPLKYTGIKIIVSGENK